MTPVRVTDSHVSGHWTRAFLVFLAFVLLAIGAGPSVLVLSLPDRVSLGSWGVGLAVTSPVMAFFVWLFFLDHPVDLVLSDNGIEIRYPRFTFTSPWSQLRPLQTTRFPLRGVTFAYASDPDDPGPMDVASLRAYIHAHPGQPQYLLTREQARSVLSDPRFPQGQIPERLRRGGNYAQRAR